MDRLESWKLFLRNKHHLIQSIRSKQFKIYCYKLTAASELHLACGYWLNWPLPIFKLDLCHSTQMHGISSIQAKMHVMVHTRSITISLHLTILALFSCFYKAHIWILQVMENRTWHACIVSFHWLGAVRELRYKIQNISAWRQFYILLYILWK